MHCILGGSLVQEPGDQNFSSRSAVNQPCDPAGGALFRFSICLGTLFIITEPITDELRQESLSCGPQSSALSTFHTSSIFCVNELMHTHTNPQVLILSVPLEEKNCVFSFVFVLTPPPNRGVAKSWMRLSTHSTHSPCTQNGALASDRHSVRICFIEQLLLVVFLFWTTTILQDSFFKEQYLQKLLLTLHLGKTEFSPSPDVLFKFAILNFCVCVCVWWFLLSLFSLITSAIHKGHFYFGF